MLIENYFLVYLSRSEYFLDENKMMLVPKQSVFMDDDQYFVYK